MVESGFLEAAEGLVGPNRDWVGCWRSWGSVDVLRGVGCVEFGGGDANVVVFCRYPCCRS